MGNKFYSSDIERNIVFVASGQYISKPSYLIGFTDKNFTATLENDFFARKPFFGESDTEAKHQRVSS